MRIQLVATIYSIPLLMELQTGIGFAMVWLTASAL